MSESPRSPTKDCFNIQQFSLFVKGFPGLFIYSIMVSLKKYTKEQILNECKQRFSKIASLLDEEDYLDRLEQSITWLDQAIFAPRAIVFEPKDVISYKGGCFIDVSAYKIDVINNAYYADTFDDQLNTILPEVGLMPYILGAQTFTSLSSVADYLALRTNLNLMSRQLEMDGDYELWPADSEGRQLLQVKNNKIIRIEFLPSLDRAADEWTLYDFEYAALKDILFDKCNLYNAELQLSATSLGVGKEAQTLTTYWQNKLDKDVKEFQEKALVTYIA